MTPKEIVWSVCLGDHCLLLKTKTKVDKEDQEVEIPSAFLIIAMNRLSEKYCNKGFAVLFDIDC